MRPPITKGVLDDLLSKCPDKPASHALRGTGIGKARIDEVCKLHYGEDFEQVRQRIHQADQATLGKGRWKQKCNRFPIRGASISPDASGF